MCSTTSPLPLSQLEGLMGVQETRGDSGGVGGGGVGVVKPRYKGPQQVIIIISSCPFLPHYTLIRLLHPSLHLSILPDGSPVCLN